MRSKLKLKWVMVKAPNISSNLLWLCSVLDYLFIIISWIFLIHSMKYRGSYNLLELMTFLLLLIISELIRSWMSSFLVFKMGYSISASLSLSLLCLLLKCSKSSSCFHYLKLIYFAHFWSYFSIVSFVASWWM